MKKSLYLLLASAALLSQLNVTLSVCQGREDDQVKNHAARPRIFDITHTITGDLPAWDSVDGTGKYIWLVSSIKKGNATNSSMFKLSTHSGTHVDAPSHFYQEYYDRGFDVTSLDLHVLNGPALVVDVPRNSNITAEVLESLNIANGTNRVLFRTLNTDRRLMHKTEFDTSFVGFKADGAEWIVNNSEIKLVGTDYLSISAYTDAIPTHLTLLKSRKIHVVEGLSLDNVPAGEYTLHCLPLRLHNADGCPSRCILVDDIRGCSV
ncbi:uncharacterized protein LOC110806694 [Carica papaya]|uniref:uncharacterized protein LOC110806694 n=1 Tax=Carica papaya TaxID=3649 RepID=UPI000B8CB13C|nr:uncharacterized protein LOC110806694 [Carica papaya]